MIQKFIRLPVFDMTRRAQWRASLLRSIRRKGFWRAEWALCVLDQWAGLSADATACSFEAFPIYFLISGTFEAGERHFTLWGFVDRWGFQHASRNLECWEWVTEPSVVGHPAYVRISHQEKPESVLINSVKCFCLFLWRRPNHLLEELKTHAFWSSLLITRHAASISNFLFWLKTSQGLQVLVPRSYQSFCMIFLCHRLFIPSRCLFDLCLFLQDLNP